MPLSLATICPCLKALSHFQEVLRHCCIGLSQSFHQIGRKLVFLLTYESVSCPLIASSTCREPKTNSVQVLVIIIAKRHMKAQTTSSLRLVREISAKYFYGALVRRSLQLLWAPRICTAFSKIYEYARLTCPSNTVHIIFIVVGRIIIDDHNQVFHIQTSCSNWCGYEQAAYVIFEVIDCTLSVCLILPAMKWEAAIADLHSNFARQHFDVSQHKC